MKKLAPEDIMNGVSKKAVEFIKQIPGHSGRMGNTKLTGVVAKAFKQMAMLESTSIRPNWRTPGGFF